MFFETQKQVFYLYLCRPCWLLVYWSLEQEKLFKGWQGNALQFLPLLLIRFLQTPIQVCKSKQVHTRPRKLFTGWQVNAARQVCAVKSSNGTTSGPTTQLPNLLYCWVWVTPRTDRFHQMRNPWPKPSQLRQELEFLIFLIEKGQRAVQLALQQHETWTQHPNTLLKI